jgi:hypothetical protein
VLVYAYARFKESGTVEYAPLHRDDVLKRKAASKAKKGPWMTWEREMWLKTAIRALAPKLPLSADLLNSITRPEDHQITEFDRLKGDAIAALGAPVEQIEQVEAEDTAEAAAAAEAHLARAIEGLREPDMQTKDELANFADMMRQAFIQLEISDERRSRILGEFNAAYLEQVRRLPKESDK